MKKLYPLMLGLAGLVCSTTLQAQADQTETPQYPPLDRCATMPSHNYMLEQHPSLHDNMEVGEANAQKWIAKNKHLAKGGVLTIPVVVHVVYDPATPGANVSDSVIHSQIDVLNEDFRRTNLDAVNTRAAFDSIAVDVEVQFCMATRDPDGNWTTGITRTESTTDFGFTPFTNSIKRTADGGKDPWPADQYLNIWVCDMSFFGQPAVLGYAQFPMSSQESIDANAVAENDGVVIQFQYFGRTLNPATAPSNRGRTTTHEVGHWLGLRHIWGDTDCSGDDFIDDTPNAEAQSNFDCNLNKNTCQDVGNPFWNGIDPGDMVENFMDYSADDCMNMFSRGQSARIWGFLSTDSLRMGLFNSPGCTAPTGVQGVSMTAADIHLYPNPSNGTFTIQYPTVVQAGSVITIMDELGREVYQTKTINGDRSIEVQLDAPKGMYFISLTTDEGRFVRKMMLN